MVVRGVTESQCMVGHFFYKKTNLNFQRELNYVSILRDPYTGEPLQFFSGRAAES